MSQITTIGLDIAKNVFHAHGADERGAMVFSRKLTRGKLLDFFAGQPACGVALEACGGAHHWARELQTMGLIETPLSAHRALTLVSGRVR